MLVRLIPIGNLSQKFLGDICNELQTLVNIRCKVLPKLQTPRETYDHFRRQYDAEKIIDILSKSSEAKFIERGMPTIFLTEDDIYYSKLNFVFGLEDLRKNVAIVSIARLKPEFYENRPNPTILTERTVKEIIHEVGHMTGLEHCVHKICIMNFSPSINDIDVKQKDFCSSCRVRMMTRGLEL
jgi:archaemetzincin